MTTQAPAGASPLRKMRLGDLLVRHGVITEEQLQDALSAQKRSGRKLGATLVELGLLTEQRLLEFLSRQLQIPLLDLSKQQVDPEIARKLPETIARRYRVLLLEEGERDVLLAMADPTDLFAQDEVARLLHKRVRQAVVRESQLIEALDRLYRGDSDLSDLAGELHEELSQADVDLDEMLQSSDVDEAPVFRLLQRLFEDALHAKASDIHIEPEEKLLRIRMRIDGVLQEQVMNEVRVGHRHLDVRLSTMPVAAGESVVMRLLDQSGGILSLEQLGMPAEVGERVRKLIRTPHGLLLVTGPTGSGKTTTLYAALNELNTPQTKIITVEDPIEYRLPRVNQVQVHEQIGLTFARVLRTALRQDPDVILVGEMRDLETAQIGLRAAITGHFVLSTLHTNSSVDTISRLLDMGAPGYLMATALQAVLAQRLVRRVCPDCAVPCTPDEHEQAWLAANHPQADLSGLRRGEGCNHCNHTGYRGRVGVYELLEIRGSLLEALRRQDIDGFARAARETPGFVTLSQRALQLATQGITSLPEVMRISSVQEH
ncbi:GspE/PulE family protein [endosymbiont of unidentified scaly snail isolate Monju]|uniref:GspE/PulE family protein n=1 Tax=endosymbiont of unidentified scaly snail isolate Monju TaxID=1248727 RepID=UPI0003892112|nr:GspE/PulE family protein [endosymbiont of unidentified scaly snail isolate Monju]BAN70139.1 MSHA biogenesis protein MshE [endosymbiont of unidentified scaly snail isolate Monju]